jgi:hypothetical protein
MAGGRKGKRDEKKPFKKRKADDDEITILDDNEDTNDGNEKVVTQILCKKSATTNTVDELGHLITDFHASAFVLFG